VAHALAFAFLPGALAAIHKLKRALLKRSFHPAGAVALLQSRGCKNISVREV
jgi:hypothetical protein